MRRSHQAIEVHVELDPAIREQPAAPILLDDPFRNGAEVLAVETCRVGCRGVIARAGEQDRAEPIFASTAGEGEPRARADHRSGLVEELVLSIAEPALLWIVEG